MCIITADHGNADEMYEIKKGKVAYNANGTPKSKTAHTLNPVPCIFYDDTDNAENIVIKDGSFGLSNVAATVAKLLNIDKPESWDESIIE